MERLGAGRGSRPWRARLPLLSACLVCILGTELAPGRDADRLPCHTHQDCGASCRAHLETASARVCDAADGRRPLLPCLRRHRRLLQCARVPPGGRNCGDVWSMQGLQPVQVQPRRHRSRGIRLDRRPGCPTRMLDDVSVSAWLLPSDGRFGLTTVPIMVWTATSRDKSFEGSISSAHLVQPSQT